MGSLDREPENKYTLLYRFRYYKDELAHDSKDVRNWYKVEIASEPDEKVVIEKTRSIFGMLANYAGDRLQECLRGNLDTQSFMEVFEAMPFVHKRQANEQEQKEFDENDKAAEKSAR